MRLVIIAADPENDPKGYGLPRKAWLLAHPEISSTVHQAVFNPNGYSKIAADGSLVLAAKNACLQIPNAASAQAEFNLVRNGTLSERAFVTRRLSQIIVVSSLLDAGVSAKNIGDSTESFFNRAGEGGLLLYIPHLLNDIGFEEVNIDFDSLENLRSRMTGELTNRNAVYALSYFLAEQDSL